MRRSSESHGPVNLFFRLIWIVIAAFRKPASGMFEETRIRLRVLPNDLDTNLHMNNGRYLTIMDLGRLDLTVRSGLWRAMRDNKWYPVVGSARMTYRRPLDPFQAFELTTRVVGWDDKWVYMEQRFMVGDHMHARGVLKALFLKGKTKVTSAELAQAMGYDDPSPPLDPDLVAALR